MRAVISREFLPVRSPEGETETDPYVEAIRSRFPFIDVVCGFDFANPDSWSSALESSAPASAGHAHMHNGIDREVHNGLDREVHNGSDREVHSGIDRSAGTRVHSVLLIPPKQPENRAELCVDFLRYAQKQGVWHAVFVSLLGAARGGTDIAFAQQMRRVEKYLEAEEIAPIMTYTFLRCAYLYDNFLSARRSIVEQKRICGSHGDGKFAAVALEGMTGR